MTLYNSMPWILTIVIVLLAVKLWREREKLRSWSGEIWTGSEVATPKNTGAASPTTTSTKPTTTPTPKVTGQAGEWPKTPLGWANLLLLVSSVPLLVTILYAMSGGTALGQTSGGEAVLPLKTPIGVVAVVLAILYGVAFLILVVKEGMLAAWSIAFLACVVIVTNFGFHWEDTDQIKNPMFLMTFGLTLAILLGLGYLAYEKKEWAGVAIVSVLGLLLSVGFGFGKVSAFLQYYVNPGQELAYQQAQEKELALKNEAARGGLLERMHSLKIIAGEREEEWAECVRRKNAGRALTDQASVAMSCGKNEAEIWCREKLTNPSLFGWPDNAVTKRSEGFTVCYTLKNASVPR